VIASGLVGRSFFFALVEFLDIFRIECWSISCQLKFVAIVMTVKATFDRYAPALISRYFTGLAASNQPVT